eukprot:m.71183 g.71183  ORF g.71183 m.71183 type:complete len:302 (+) comp11700_c0_seq1:222-1127(+)
MQDKRAQVPPTTQKKNLADLVQLQPSSTLLFTGKGVQQQTVDTELNLKNLTNGIVIYKIKTTKPKAYCVRPNSGTLSPGASAVIQVAMQSFKEPRDDYAKHKFQVQMAMVRSNPADVAQAFKDEVTAATPQQEKRLKCRFKDVVLESGEMLEPAKKNVSKAKPPMTASKLKSSTTSSKSLPKQALSPVREDAPTTIENSKEVPVKSPSITSSVPKGKKSRSTSSSAPERTSPSSSKKNQQQSDTNKPNSSTADTQKKTATTTATATDAVGAKTLTASVFLVLAAFAIGVCVGYLVAVNTSA